MTGIELDYAQVSDVGRVRQVNEDSAIAETPYFLVADGMGGHEAGDLASRAALEAFGDAIPAGAATSVQAAGAALEAARVAVAEVARGRARGAGCTLTGAVLVEHDGELLWLVLNIGDSRVYLHRGSELQQLTVDHSLIEEARRSESGERLPPRNIITRALGSADTTADSWLLPVETGSRLLICSDGLTTEVEDEQLRAVLTMGGRAQLVAEELVRRANEAGGRDNVTAVVVDVLAGPREWHVGGTTASRGRPGEETEGDKTVTATRPVRRRRKP